MAQKYARGTRAWGICGRSGRKMLLRDMVFDGRYPNMRVDPAWFEGKHPQEYLPKIDDPIALWRPAPENPLAPSQPVLTLETVDLTAALTWTPAVSDLTEMKSYTVFRSVDNGAFTTLVLCAINRDFLGGIASIEHCTSQVTPPGSDKQVQRDYPVTYVDSTLEEGHTYCYYVQAFPLGNTISTAQGPPSPISNTLCTTIEPGASVTAPVLTVSTTSFFDGSALIWENELDWTAAVPTDCSITGYDIYLDIDGGGFSLINSVSDVTLQYFDDYIAAMNPTLGTYTYHVIVNTDVGGVTAQSNDAAGDFPPPRAPGSQTFSVGAGNSSQNAFNPPPTTEFAPAFGRPSFTPSGNGAGTITPDPTTIDAANIVIFGAIRNDDNSTNYIVLCVEGSFPQDYFTNLTFNDGAGGGGHNYNLSSASASFNGVFSDANFTTWAWTPVVNAFPPLSQPITVNW